MALAALLALFAPGCASDGGGSAPTPPDRTRTAMDPAFAPAFDALHAAVEAGDDAVARQILAAILARGPAPHLVDFAHSYERILDGRRAMEAVTLSLESEPVIGSALDYRLVLRIEHDRPDEIVLRLPPGSLQRLVVGIDAEGNDRREVTTSYVDAIPRLPIPPATPVRVPLESYELPLAGRLAVRERWAYELRSGEILVGETVLPAQAPEVAPAQRIRLAPFLPVAPVEPAELVDYIQREVVNLPPLVERAVRIDPARRGEALDLLAPLVQELARTDPERLARVAPALRWLARTGRPGADPEAWVEWFALRAARGEPGTPEGLELPLVLDGLPGEDSRPVPAGQDPPRGPGRDTRGALDIGGKR